MFNNRKPLTEADDGFNPIDGIYDFDDSNYMGGTRRKKARSRSKRTKGRRKLSNATRKRRRRTRGLFGRRRRRVPRRKVKTSSRRGVKYTKNGQPYIILANGRARFIKGKRHK